MRRHVLVSMLALTFVLGFLLGTGLRPPWLSAQVARMIAPSRPALFEHVTPQLRTGMATDEIVLLLGEPDAVDQLPWGNRWRYCYDDSFDGLALEFAGGGRHNPDEPLALCFARWTEGEWEIETPQTCLFRLGTPLAELFESREIILAVRE